MFSVVLDIFIIGIIHVFIELVFPCIICREQFHIFICCAYATIGQGLGNFLLS